MQKIIVASKNPVKIHAAEDGFRLMFPEGAFEIEGVTVPSGVPDQPMSDAETFAGAWNRATGASGVAADAHFYVGIEGGIEERDGELAALAWVVVRSSDGRFGKGRSGTFFLPERLAVLVRAGRELGDASDEVFNEKNSKQGLGTVGFLSGGVMDRTQYYVSAVTLALFPFRNAHLYSNRIATAFLRSQK
ncbi:MAG: inosine/xanthosine triphosphatase [bacterium]|nr:inosine/xanthosine triphosphatase [bacterium]MDZ4285176.1 inosine/xanthosine triphosphatase [Patescibacteria group bacterium]